MSITTHDTGHVFLTAAQVRARYGGISDMSLWRWLHDPDLAFPRPLRVNRRRFWKLVELEAWERRQAAPRQGGSHQD